MKRLDGDSSIALVGSLVGNRLVGIKYIYPAGLATLPLDESQRLHEVDHGIDLIFSDGNQVTLMWQMDSECAALCAVREPERSGELTDLVEGYDVSSLNLWAPILGSPIARVGVAWHLSEQGCSDTPWAFRFMFENGRFFVVALAEVKASGLAYMPSNISVLFDRPTSDSLRAFGSNVSSWGEDL